MDQRGLLLFDIDGTLVDCAGAGMRSLVRAVCLLHDEPERSWSSLTPDGLTDPLLAAQVLELVCGREPRSEAEVTEVLARYAIELEQTLRDSPDYRVLPGVMALLGRLQDDRGWLPGLGTGNIEQGALLKLKRGGLEGYFHFGGFGSDSARRDLILARARQRGEHLLGREVAPREVVVVGDTVRDIDAARANGFPVLAVATGRTRRGVLEQAGADEVLDDLSDERQVLAVLGRLRL